MSGNWARTDLKPWRTASLCSCSVGSKPFWKREHDRPLQLHRSRQEGQRHTPSSHNGSTCADPRSIFSLSDCPIHRFPFACDRQVCRSLGCTFTNKRLKKVPGCHS